MTPVTKADEPSAPRVGVPWRTARDERDNIRHRYDDYLRAVRQAGGEPVEISLGLGAPELRRFAATLDAVVLPGSPADVDPSRYNAARHRESADADPDRERTDFALIDESLNTGKPLLAICYGTQLLNVRLGGSLYQDIASELGSPIRHSKRGLPQGAADPLHPAGIEAGSRIFHLAAACGLDSARDSAMAQVNTSHHQAIRDIGDGLRVAARAPDDVIEAVEYESDGHWLIGVQWHPERMQGDALSLALFRDLVMAARAAEHSSRRDS